jgi:dTDP-4-dehydrorhamnose reductase
MRILVTGASGQLGGYLLRELRGRGADVVAWSGSRPGDLFGVSLRPVDLADRDGVAAAFRAARPGVVVHAAALSSVAGCHRDPARAHAVNAGGSELLAELAEGAGARLLLVSTDLVFDGEHAPYTEADAPSPLSVYGRTKGLAEAAVLARGRAVVARVSLLFGLTVVGRPSFFDEQVAALREGRPCPLFADEWRTPLGLPTAARALLTLARSDFTGVLHLGGPERMSRLEMGRRLAAFLGADPSSLVATTRGTAAAPEPRPRDTSLDPSRWRALFPRQPWPAWDEALREMGVG